MPNESPWPLDALLVEIEQSYAKERITSSWPDEKEAVKHALESISASLSSCLPPRRYRPLSVLGVGGSGIVLSISDLLFPSVSNALKFPRPVGGKVAVVAELLNKEISSLAALRHPGIARILFYATLHGVAGYGDLPFYLREAADGLPSKNFVRESATAREKFLLMLRETVDIIRYLHTREGIRFAHLDIKPENIIIDGDGRPTIIDLGTCKRLDGDESLTLVACTRSYAHPALARQLAKDPTDDKRARGELPRSMIDPQWDLWSLGLTFLTWLGLDFADGSHEKAALLDRLPVYTRKYLLLLCARLVTYSVPLWLSRRVGLSEAFLKAFPITSADELCDALGRLDDSHGPIDQVLEMTPATTGSIQAAPGVHVINTDRLTATLNHRLVRRLNTITQLGGVSQVYPGAKHSRREHCLGTYANTGSVLRALYEDPVSPLFKQILSEQDIREILLTALLHDIGQYPLAHDLQEIDKIFDHEQLTQAMLKGVWTKKKSNRSGPSTAGAARGPADQRGVVARSRRETQGCFDVV